MLDNIITMKCSVDQSPPKKFDHIARKEDTNRKKQIETENDRLLSNIVGVMSRRNNSVAHARAAPKNIAGGGIGTAVPGGQFVVGDASPCPTPSERGSKMTTEYS